MNEITIGVMGCASIAERHMIPAINESKYFKLKYVTSRSIEKAKIFSEKFKCGYLSSYEDLVNAKDIEVIYIPLPIGLHYKWAIKSLESGKHLIIEKSLACNIEEVREIINLAKKRCLLVMENYMFEFHMSSHFQRQYLALELI